MSIWLHGFNDTPILRSRVKPLPRDERMSPSCSSQTLTSISREAWCRNPLRFCSNLGCLKARRHVPSISVITRTKLCLTPTRSAKSQSIRGLMLGIYITGRPTKGRNIMKHGVHTTCGSRSISYRHTIHSDKQHTIHSTKQHTIHSDDGSPLDRTTHSDIRRPAGSKAVGIFLIVRA